MGKIEPQNGELAVGKWMVKIVTAAAGVVLSAGFVWLISTTHITAANVQKIIITMNMVMKHLDGLPKEFPPKEYRREVDERFRAIESLVSHNNAILQSTNFFRKN